MPTEPTECWLPVVEYEGLYEVSDLGNVRSLRTFVLHKEGKPIIVHEGLLHPALDRDGYPIVILCRDDKKEWVHRVHRLVAKTFIGPRPHGKLVRHENGFRLDNKLSNLSYGTAKQNGEDRTRHRTAASGESHPQAKLNNEAVQDIIARGSSRKRGIYTQLAREYGVSYVMISNIVNGRHWKSVKVEGTSREDLAKKRLTEDVVREIKKRIQGGVRQTRIAKDFGVSQQLISCIQLGKAWPHVTVSDGEQ